MVEDCTVGIDTTGSRTRINTLAVDTGEVGGTVITEETFWFTLLQWISLVVSDTLTYCLATLDLALGIDATWIRITWISGRSGLGWRCLSNTSGEWISSHARWTTTVGAMLSDLTDSRQSTGARAGINTFLCNTSKALRTVSIL